MDEKAVRVKQPATAGTSESNDILIMLYPGEAGIEIDLESVVCQQYGTHIKQLITSTLESFGVSSAKVMAKDKGALDFTIIARVKSALERSNV